MFTWNGIGVAIPEAVGEIQKQVKQRKTTIYIVAVALAVGIILFLRGK